MSADIAVMLNEMRVTFEFLCYLNADERRDTDPDYRHGYSFVTLPLVRTLIDGLYNITALLDDPGKARLFRLSGYKRMLAALGEEEALHGSEKGWPEYIRQQRDILRIGYEADNFDEEALKQKAEWQTLSRYLQSPPADDSEHKMLMRRLTYGHWRQYSEMSHMTFRGVHELFEMLNTEEAPHEFRPSILERAERSLTMHLGRAAALLLAAVTEAQAAYRFEGHDVNARIHAMWRGMVAFPEGQDMYDARYNALIEQKGIKDMPSDPL